MIILGSSSPRRKEILNFFKLSFKQVSPPFDESTITFLRDPEKYVIELSLKKALSLLPQFPNSAIITADTIVYKEEKIYEKPKNDRDAYKILKKLNNTYHYVYTGICIVTDDKQYTDVGITKVYFNDFSDQELKSYAKSNHVMDKAGAYSIQDEGSLIVKKIDGCFYNVMGLPINKLRSLLKKINIDLLNYIK